MNATQELASVMPMLSSSLLSDLAMSLAFVNAWLLPVLPEDDEDGLITGLLVCRECFPSIYVEAIQKLRDGEESMSVEGFIVSAINEEMGFDCVTFAEELKYGIRLVSEAADPLNPDWEHYAKDDLLEVLRWFDKIDTHAETVANALIKSLVPFEHLQDVAWLVAWMFGETGSDLADYTDEDIFEFAFDWPQWTVADVEYAKELHDEAAEIAQNALHGLEMLKQDEALRTIFQENIKRLARRKRDKHGRITNTRCTWRITPDQTADDSDVLPVRDHLAA